MKKGLLACASFKCIEVIYNTCYLIIYQDYFWEVAYVIFKLHTVITNRYKIKKKDQIEPLWAENVVQGANLAKISLYS